jgi:hypothetical protein
MWLGIRRVNTVEEDQGWNERLRVDSLIRAVCMDLCGLLETPTRES